MLTFFRIVEVVYASIGALIFSLYVIYDTYNICNVLHPDEYIVGAVNLYAFLTRLFIR
jgi:protein lifeguard